MEKEEKKVVKQVLEEEELNQVAGGKPMGDKKIIICSQKTDLRGNLCQSYVFR